MGIAAFLDEVRADTALGDRVAHMRREEERPARLGRPRAPLGESAERILAARGIDELYSHQAEAVDLARDDAGFLLTTGPASGKTLCYLLPIIDAIAADRNVRALLLHPAKALSRDQLGEVRRALSQAGLDPDLAAAADGDTSAGDRRRARDEARIILTNPDFLHAAILPVHGRWSAFLSRLRYLVVDELHVYSGIFGANAAWLFERLRRVCRHHGASPTLLAASATIPNAGSLSTALFGRAPPIVDEDGSPRGPRTFLLWNPPRVRATRRRSRRSANVEATDLFASLVRRGVRTICFSKARVTAELIHRYARDALRRTAPSLAKRITPYRGGYRPEERREIEARLFGGELLGVSTTRALELGIDVGGLDAAVIVGWPGTVSSFFQQAGRAGRRGRESLVILVGLDTATNQYVLRRPEYVFDRPVEEARFDRENPFVLAGHLRCATHELPLCDREAKELERDALGVLEENGKVRRIRGAWYHAANEVPQHEISLRDATDRNVVIRDAQTERVLGEVSKFDAPAVVHPGAIHIHRGETWRVLHLDVTRSLALARREEVDYYTQSHGGEDVHHVDHVVRSRRFGAGRAGYGEVTAHYRIFAYERIRFYTLDAFSRHGLELPTYPIPTTAFWIEPPEDLLREVKRDGLDPSGGLRGIGFALRTLLPTFVTCDTLDLSHSIGSANTPWQTVFVWEHYRNGLGFTLRGYEVLHRLAARALALIEDCDCENGCPLCVGKPLHPYTVLNPERGEGSIPSREAARRILSGLLEGESGVPGEESRETEKSQETEEGRRIRITGAIRRHLERQREPDVVAAAPPGPPGPAEPEPAGTIGRPDAEVRGERRRAFARRLRRRLQERPDRRRGCD